MSASDVQIGGDHYKNMAIQPLEFIMANRLPFPEGAIIQYVCRWRRKGGIEDLQKARHLLDWLIEHKEKEKGRPAGREGKADNENRDFEAESLARCVTALQFDMAQLDAIVMGLSQRLDAIARENPVDRPAVERDLHDGEANAFVAEALRRSTRPPKRDEKADNENIGSIPVAAFGGGD